METRGWPALFALDEWSLCQGHGDVYCMVDAVLVGRDSSLLHELQEYSQSLKHYNRTQIHRGVCVSRCAVDEYSSGNGTWGAAQRCVNDSVAQYGLQAQVLSVDLCTTSHSSPDTTAAYVLAVVSLVLLMMALLATTLHMFEVRWGNLGGNKYVLAFSLKKNWQILMNNRSNPRIDDRTRDIAYIEGIRFLGVQGVVLSHILFMFIYSFPENPQFLERMYDQLVWKVIFSSLLWLQSFFSLSGFLTTYAVLMYTEKKPFTWFEALLAVIDRVIRLTPVAVYLLWVTIAWFPLVSLGPQWAWGAHREAHHCAERWLYHLFYVQNYLPLGKMCMGHTWYLAADLQLHIVGMLVLLVIVRYRKAAAPALAGLMLASSLTAGLVTYFYQLTPITTSQTPESIRTLFAGSKIIMDLYIPSWMNVPGYVSGISTAFLLYQTQQTGLKLNQKQWFRMIFHLSPLVGGVVVGCGALFLSDAAPPPLAAAVYAALDRPLVSVCLNIFLLGCFVRCKSVLRNLLEWRGFHPLGRLSYCAFLVHSVVLRLIFSSSQSLLHVSIFSMVTWLITTLVVTYVAAVPLYLLLERPTVQLWKAFVVGDNFDDKKKI